MDLRYPHRCRRALHADRQLRPVGASWSCGRTSHRQHPNRDLPEVPEHGHGLLRQSSPHSLHPGVATEHRRSPHSRPDRPSCNHLRELHPGGCHPCVVLLAVGRLATGDHRRAALAVLHLHDVHAEQLPVPHHGAGGQRVGEALGRPDGLHAEHPHGARVQPGEHAGRETGEPSSHCQQAHRATHLESGVGSRFLAVHAVHLPSGGTARRFRDGSARTDLFHSNANGVHDGGHQCLHHGHEPRLHAQQQVGAEVVEQHRGDSGPTQQGRRGSRGDEEGGERRHRVRQRLLRLSHASPGAHPQGRFIHHSQERVRRLRGSLGLWEEHDHGVVTAFLQSRFWCDIVEWRERERVEFGLVPQ